MNNITINGKDYNRDELSNEVNLLIDKIGFLQAERERQRLFIDAAELESNILFVNLFIKFFS